MVSGNTHKRSLKGFLLNSFIDFKKTAFIGTLITIGIFLVNFVFFTLKLTPNDAYDMTYSTSSANVLSQGYLTMIITFCIAIFVTTNKNEFGRKFVFPLNRNIYAIGNFFFIIVGSYALMVIICGLEIMEVVISMILSMALKDFYYISTMTIPSFFIGFFISLSYMVFIVSFVYVLSIFFHKYRLVTSIIIPLIIAAIVIYPNIKILVMDMYSYIFKEPSILYLCLKLWVLTALFHLIAYIPLKRMEVIK